MFDPPIFVNVRDRLTPLVQLVDWLERAGHQRIILLDNQSTWPPLLEYLDRTDHQVVRLDANLGTRAIWDAGLVPDEFYVYTDPDIVPIDECPTDAVARLHEWLQRRPDFPKAGLGLYLDDVPSTMPHLRWERSLVADVKRPEAGIPSYRIAPGAFASQIDTTFALYRPRAPFVYEAIRLGHPYQARHLSQSWYGGPLTDEDRYYLAHASREPVTGSSWAAAA